MDNTLKTDHLRRSQKDYSIMCFKLQVVKEVETVC